MKDSKNTKTVYIVTVDQLNDGISDFETENAYAKPFGTREEADEYFERKKKEFTDDFGCKGSGCREEQYDDGGSLARMWCNFDEGCFFDEHYIVKLDIFEVPFAE